MAESLVEQLAAMARERDRLDQLLMLDANWRALRQLDEREAAGEPLQVVDGAHLRAALETQLSANRLYAARAAINAMIRTLQGARFDSAPGRPNEAVEAVAIASRPPTISSRIVLLADADQSAFRTRVKVKLPEKHIDRAPAAEADLGGGVASTRSIVAAIETCAEAVRVVSGVTVASSASTSTEIARPDIATSADIVPTLPPSARPLFGELDDLNLISGFGSEAIARLAADGVVRFAQIAAWTSADTRAWRKALAHCARGPAIGWVEQSAVLASGRYTYHAERIMRRSREEQSQGPLVASPLLGRTGELPVYEILSPPAASPIPATDPQRLDDEADAVTGSARPASGTGGLLSDWPIAQRASASNAALPLTTSLPIDAPAPVTSFAEVAALVAARGDDASVDVLALIEAAQSRPGVVAPSRPVAASASLGAAHAEIGLVEISAAQAGFASESPTERWKRAFDRRARGFMARPRSPASADANPVGSTRVVAAPVVPDAAEPDATRSAHTAPPSAKASSELGLSPLVVAVDADDVDFPDLDFVGEIEAEIDIRRGDPFERLGPVLGAELVELVPQPVEFSHDTAAGLPDDAQSVSGDVARADGSLLRRLSHARAPTRFDGRDYAGYRDAVEEASVSIVQPGDPAASEAASHLGGDRGQETPRSSKVVAVRPSPVDRFLKALTGRR